MLSDRSDNPYYKACTKMVFLDVHSYRLYKPMDWSRRNDSALDPAAHHVVHIENLLGEPQLLRSGAPRQDLAQPH